MLGAVCGRSRPVNRMTTPVPFLSGTRPIDFVAPRDLVSHDLSSELDAKFVCDALELVFTLQEGHPIYVLYGGVSICWFLSSNLVTFHILRYVGQLEVSLSMYFSFGASSLFGRALLMRTRGFVLVS